MLARRFDEALRPFDLTSGQFSLLVSLNRPEPPTINSVATLLAMDRTTLTANLKPLERRGLLKVAVDKEDKRARRLLITAAGRNLLQKAYPTWKATHAEVERLITGGSADTAPAISHVCQLPREIEPVVLASATAAAITTARKVLNAEPSGVLASQFCTGISYI